MVSLLAEMGAEIAEAVASGNAQKRRCASEADGSDAF